MAFEELVITLSEHRKLGQIFVPYVVDTSSKDGFYPLLNRVTVNNIRESAALLSDSDIKIIKILEEFSDKQLFKVFYKKKEIKNAIEFIDKVPAEYVKTNIRPYIDRRMVRCIELISELHKNNISTPKLYFKSDQKTIYKTREIRIIEQPVEVVFNFIKTSDEITYYLSILYNKIEIRISDKKGFILTNEPCFLVLENNIFHFRSSEGNDINGKKILPFFSKEFIRIPKSAEKKYFETFILNSIRDYSANAIGFEIEEIYPEKKTVLTFDTDLKGEPVFILSFQYGRDVFLPNEKIISMVNLIQNNDVYKYQKYDRDVEWERIETEKINALGIVSDDGTNFKISNISKESSLFFYDYVSWLNEHGSKLNNNNIEFKQNFQVKYCTQEIKLEISAESENDWFDIHAYVIIENLRIPFICFKKHIINGLREYVLPNGEIAILPAEWFHKYKDLLNFADDESETIKINKHHFLLVKDSITNSDNEFKSKLKDLLVFISKPKEKNIIIPLELQANLRKYQREGFAWLFNLHKHRFGGCLADDMGLGKTLQAIALLLKIKNNYVPVQDIANTNQNVQLSLFNDLDFYSSFKSTVRTNLIVLPTSLVHNWENEFIKFAPSLKVTKYLGNSRDIASFSNYDVVLTTYGIARNDIGKLKNIKFNYLILDESQYIKNADSKIYQAVLELNGSHKLVLTGTPIENSLSDLWSQINFINRGMLGTLSFFRNEFIVPIEKNNDAEKQKKLQQLISPFILRRTKSEVAKDLPPLTEQIIYCDMTEDHRNIYEKEKSSIRNSILENIEKIGIQKSSFLVLQGLTKLRLLANHPVLHDSEYVSDSGKFEEITRNIENLVLEKHKVLIFSSFVKHLNIIANQLSGLGHKYVMLTGNTQQNDRQKIINDFQNSPDIPIFLISLKAGGVGLNLISADYVFIADPWWNPAAEDQAISRAHRIGQNKNVFAYKFISTNTIEEKIHNLQKRKSQLADLFINSGTPLKNIELKNIMELFE